MNKISVVRREGLVPILGLADDTLRQFQDRVWSHMRDCVPELVDRHLFASDASTALLMLAGLLAGDRDTIADRTARLWAARFIDQYGNPPWRWDTAGEALTALLRSPAARQSLDYVEIHPLIPDISICWDVETAWLVFAPFPDWDPWAARVAEIEQTGVVQRPVRLPGTAFDKIAAKL